MTSDIIIVLSILAAGFILFIAEVFTIDVTAVSHIFTKKDKNVWFHICFSGVIDTHLYKH